MRHCNWTAGRKHVPTASSPHLAAIDTPLVTWNNVDDTGVRTLIADYERA